MRNIISILIMTVFIGCLPPKMYYWGNYSGTLYNYKKGLTPELLEKHKGELREIIDKSDEQNLRIPPGVNAELAYILLLENNSEEARVLFEKELSIYPESSKFINDLVNSISEDN